MLGGLIGRGEPSYDVAGKVALITGAGRGIGFELARSLHGRGATVALLDVDSSQVAKAADRLGEERRLWIEGDVRDRAAMAAAVEQVVDRCGGLDVVVANAGVAPRAATLRTIDPDEYDRVIEINQTGVFNTVKPAIEPVIDRGGHIVVVASVAAFAPGVGGAPYMISKAAVEQLGRALRIELAPFGASAGVAYFGIVSTDMVHSTIDADPIMDRGHLRLPRPLRKRISPQEAATVIADGIARRADRTIAPSSWEPWAMGRGALNVVIDRVAARDRRVGDLVRELEARAG